MIQQVLTRSAAIATLGILLLGSVPVSAASPSPSPTPSTDPNTPPADDGTGGGMSMWGVQPSSQSGPDGRAAFEYAVAPGASVTDYVGVSNFGDTALTIRLYATDAFNTDDGSFALLTADQAPTDIGAWVELAEDTYTIPPRKRIDVPFRLQVPPNAEPGDHIGGVVASVEVPTTDPGGSAVMVDRRVGSRIYLRVEGPIEPSLVIEGLRAAYDAGWDPIAGTTTVTFTVRNTGNVRLAARQRVSVTGPFGWRLKELVLTDLPEILPGSSIAATTTVTAIPPVGPLTGTVHIEPYPTSGDIASTVEQVTEQTEVWAWPLLLAGIVLLLVEAVAGIRWWRRRTATLAGLARDRAIEAARAEGMALGRAEASATGAGAAAPPTQAIDPPADEPDRSTDA